MNQFFQLIIGVLVAAGILNTLLMSVLERTREFGVMLAIGAAPSRLAGLIMAESMWIGLVGLGMGALVTAPWSYYLYTTGIDMSAALGEGATMNGVAFDPVLRYALPPEMLLGILAVLFSLTLGAGLYPAWRASRVPPLEALRVI
jgi:ABC-type lipoprotein release transport system permease subunit